MRNNRKTLIGVILVSLFLILLIYVTNISSLPDNIIMFQGEHLNLQTLFGVSLEEKKDENHILNDKAVQASSGVDIDENYTGKINLGVNLFGINVKDITVNVIEETDVVPLGDLVGLKLYTNGVLVVGMSEISGMDNIKYKPYEDTGILEGDMIVEADLKTITTTEDLIECVNASKGHKINLKYVRGNSILETNIKPVETSKNNFKLGLWVRDAAAGVGTISFYEPESKLFASLGHGIIDVDTEKLLDISGGEFVTTNIVSIVKGEKGNPRENTRFR